MVAKSAILNQQHIVNGTTTTGADPTAELNLFAELGGTFDLDTKTILWSYLMQKEEKEAAVALYHWSP